MIEPAVVFLLIVAVVALAWSCTPDRSDRMTVAVSILPQKYIVNQIAAGATGATDTADATGAASTTGATDATGATGAVDVQVMIPAGSSPEAYDPTPQDFIRLGHSSVYFAVGDLNFEQAWLPRLADQNPGMKIVNTSAGIPASRAAAGIPAGGAATADPHLWTSTRHMKAMGRAVCDALVEIDTARADIYKHNYERFAARMDTMHERVARLCAIAPSRVFVIYHPALTAFAEEFGLTQIAVERDHKEPSATELGALIEEIRASGARVLLMQQEFNVHMVEPLAAETGLRVVTIHPLAEDWETEMLHIALELSR